MNAENNQIAVIGMGYVGLPLAVAFAEKYYTIGFDINTTRIKEIKKGLDKTQEIESKALLNVLVGQKTIKGLFVSTEIEDLRNSNYYIVTVPTPIDKNHKPDLTPLFKASEAIGHVLKKGDTVIYESTVYPGVTEEECAPILEKISGLIYNVDFFCGYSPERINPGDKEHTITKIKKVTSGSTPDIAKKVDALYKSIIVAGTHLAPSIKVAEAAKVIENSQRDINIAFINELSKIFNKIGIRTKDVLDAAETKWNFLKFKPGLVGGHCIGVDPYYLAQKAQELGYHPEIILSGRRLNDSMSEYVAMEVIRLMIKKDLRVKGAEILIMGITFKENCPDIRNSKVVDIITVLERFETNITILDPHADPEEVKQTIGKISIQSIAEDGNGFDGIILAVAHDSFRHMDLTKLTKEQAVIYDIKGLLPTSMTDSGLY
ncbi:MAG: UDP-N-acetyl-D-galactosamine dehydrogenase [Flammeovirgaceae bacterium TMED32]|nr:MAG: UDP-N-acetyl-D-galactosamine dehydrogenase [Flammeovirgaceae bacterium TMED32]|tara:strand:- start:809 stop:2104 length:1296 start_codon:yes stop_codon:yes gene_type:complete